MEEEFQTDSGVIKRQVESMPPIEAQEGIQLIKVLTDHEELLDTMRNEFRGERMYRNANGEFVMKQVEKPMFVELDDYNKPLKKFNKVNNQYEYICVEEAVNELVNSLKLCGLNPVAPMTSIDENEVRADLLEMESKWAVLLTVNRKKWGLQKAQYPVAIGNIKVLLKDARYRSKDGNILKALRTITSRIEHSNEQKKSPTAWERVKSPFA